MCGGIKASCVILDFCRGGVHRGVPAVTHLRRLRQSNLAATGSQGPVLSTFCAHGSLICPAIVPRTHSVTVHFIQMGQHMGKLLGIFGAVIFLFIAGCAKEPPKCNSPEAIELVKDIFRTRLLPIDYKGLSKELFDAKTSIELAAPNRYDKEIRKLECGATFVVDASAGVDQQGRATLTNSSMLETLGFTSKIYQVSKEIENGRFAFEVSYSNQIVDDHNLVAVSGVDSYRAFLTGAYVAGHRSSVKQADQHLAVQKPLEIVASAEPPKCSSPEVQAVLKMIFSRRVISAAEEQMAMRSALGRATTSDQIEANKAELLDALGVQDVATNGYDAVARKRTCQAKIFEVDAALFKIPTRYDVQSQENSEEFLVSPMFEMPNGLEGFNLLIGLRDLLVQAMTKTSNELAKEASPATQN